MKTPLLTIVILGTVAMGTVGAAERFEISGYGQFRYVDQLDVGGDEWQVNQFRVKLTANLDPDTKFVLQAEESYKLDEAAFHWVDAYLQHRFQPAFIGRAGLTYVPFGFDNLQGTPKRIPLDSPEVISRLLPGKRDQGLYAIYSPLRYSKRFREMEKSDYGTSDFGILSAGWYGGQGRDHSPYGLDHLTLRAAYPFTFGAGQMGEAGLSYFTGDYRTVNSGGDSIDVNEHALGAHAFIAPRPWGLLAEYVDGKMPGVAGGQTVSADFDGWYVQGMYRVDPKLTLYVRRDEFNGFRKAPDAQPKTNDFERTSYGVRRAISTEADLTVEYEDISKNGTEGDRWSVQLMTVF